MAIMKESTKNIIKYLQGIGDANVTASDVADALNIDKKKVDGVFTQAIQRKGLGVRVPKEVELPDGTHKQVKFLKLNDEGMAYDVDGFETAVED